MSKNSILKILSHLCNRKLIQNLTVMNTTLEKLVNQTLPSVSSSSVTYNAERNMFLTSGYTSGMGHTYFQGIHLSDRVAVVYSIGQGGYGYNPYFLNGVTVYCFDGKEKKIIGKWAPYGWAFYDDCLAQRIATELLYDYLKSQMKLQGAYISDRELKDFATAQINAAATNKPVLNA